MPESTTRTSAAIPDVELQSLMQRRDGPGLLFLAAHLATLLATGVLRHLALDSWWAVPPTALPLRVRRARLLAGAAYPDPQRMARA